MKIRKPRLVFCNSFLLKAYKGVLRRVLQKRALVFIFIFLFSGFTVRGGSSHVIHILVDGLAAIHLKTVMEQQPETIPTFMRLMRESAYTLNARPDYHSTETLPNTMDVLTGRPLYPENTMPSTSYHKFYYNTWIQGATVHQLGNPNLGYITSVFDVAHDYGLKTGFFGGKAKFDIIPYSYNEENGAPDDIGEDNGNNKIDYWEVLDWDSGLNTVPAFLSKMQEYKFNYVFLHIADLDFIGHYYGWGSARWNAQLAVVDSYLGQILSLVDTDDELAGNTTIIITADHGGGVPVNSHIYPEYQLNYTIPIFIRGPGWDGGRDLYSYFSNRVEPGGKRPKYTDKYQPLRNGDTSNIALAVLGLPPIPYSWFVPQFGEPPLVIELIKLDNNLVKLQWWWPDSDIILEFADSMNPGQCWEQVPVHFEEKSNWKFVYLLNDHDKNRFFRVRKNIIPQ
jgi:predicted AlkP superfamily pyrophosphatase or phosphodiesterase